jgi:hypothetical protein
MAWQHCKPPKRNGHPFCDWGAVTINGSPQFGCVNADRQDCKGHPHPTNEVRPAQAQKNLFIIDVITNGRSPTQAIAALGMDSYELQTNGILNWIIVRLNQQVNWIFSVVLEDDNAVSC